MSDQITVLHVKSSSAQLRRTTQLTTIVYVLQKKMVTL